MFLRKVNVLNDPAKRKPIMRGVQFLVDEEGRKQGVLIDLKKNARLWEDFYDVAVAKSREKEPRESLESVKRRLGINSGRR